MVTSEITYRKTADLLPHRAPILMVDIIESYVPGVSLTAVKHIAEDNPFFEGHFPGHPILPGVMLVEMMFQTCGLYGRMEASAESAGGGNGRPRMGRAIKIENASFLKEVLPGTTLKAQVFFKSKLMNFSTYEAKVFSGKSTVAKGIVTVALV
jgi:3-hydroxyacyl-[acyl-carrier-protein] dehydratase